MFLRNGRAFVVVALGALVLLGAGCRKRQSAVQPSEEPAIDPVAKLFGEIDGLIATGNTNDVLKRLDGAMGQADLKDKRAPIFAGLIKFLLYVDRVEEAEKRMLAACEKDAEMTRDSFGLIYGYLMERGRHVEAAEWAERLLAVPNLPADRRSHLFDWRLNARLASANAEGVVGVAREGLAALPPAEGSALLARAFDGSLNQGLTSLTERLLDLAQPLAASRPDVRQAVVAAGLRFQALREDWPGIQREFPGAAADLPDEVLQALFRQIVAAAAKARQTAVVDALCEQIVFRQPGKQQTLLAAARLWVENAAAAGDPAAVPVRLDALLRAKVPGGQVAELFTQRYYALINRPAVLEPMMKLGERLVPLAESDDTRNTLRTMLLDGSFVREDYATAIRLLEAGIPGRDAAWHAMALSKVRAHKALQDEQPRQAVKHFREFMVQVASGKDEDTVDPESNVMHTRDMILGRNARRIGDILASIPDAEAAAQAYAEARGCYEKAVAKLKDQPAARQIAEQEMARIPPEKQP
jgi:tetratricopeptide (TPR) repeat protein